jgi:predicted RNA-binding protein YlqC (UPF0109 family)
MPTRNDSLGDIVRYVLEQIVERPDLLRIEVQESSNICNILIYAQKDETCNDRGIVYGHRHSTLAALEQIINDIGTHRYKKYIAETGEPRRRFTATIKISEDNP